MILPQLFEVLSYVEFQLEEDLHIHKKSYFKMNENAFNKNSQSL